MNKANKVIDLCEITDEEAWSMDIDKLKDLKRQGQITYDQLDILKKRTSKVSDKPIQRLAGCTKCGKKFDPAGVPYPLNRYCSKCRNM